MSGNRMTAKGYRHFVEDPMDLVYGIRRSLYYVVHLMIVDIERAASQIDS